MKNYKESCKHIVEEAEFVLTRTDGLTFEQFASDETLKRAIVRSFEIIGEAVKQIPESVTVKYPGTEWRNIARMRDKLIHHYFGVDYTLVWDVARNHLAGLKRDIETIMKEG